MEFSKQNFRNGISMTHEMCFRTSFPV